MAALPTAWLAGCSGVLDPAGPVSASEKIILIDAVAIMLTIVVPVIVATFAFPWWFRASNTRATYRPDWVYSGRLEVVIWAIPAMIVIFVGGIGWLSAHDLDPQKPLQANVAPIEVEVVSLDWKWLFIYPKAQVASVNQLVLPVGVPVHFRLTSGTVMNSFFVPQLGSQIYTMAGMVTKLNLQADRTGDFAGISAQFSGDGFSRMGFNVKVLPVAGYSQWLTKASHSADALDAAQLTLLKMPTQALAPRTYGPVPAGLFDQLVAELNGPASSNAMGAATSSLAPVKQGS